MVLGQTTTSDKDIVQYREACTWKEDENRCLRGHLWDSIHPDSKRYVEKSLRFQVREILC